jgi:FMN-dependent NADH-azoreductase
MANILHIDASPRGERSHSRRMTREFVELRLADSIAKARTRISELVAV